MAGHNRAEYIGDGVTATYDGFGIWLRTPRLNGEHEIYLEPDVYHRLTKFVENVGAQE